MNSTNRQLKVTVLLLAILVGVSPLGARDPACREMVYAMRDGIELKLDLYHPDDLTPSPVIVWVHGGAWRSGSKASVPIKPLLADGFAIASVDYRLSPVAKFPAQVIDIREAIRFLTDNAQPFLLDPDKMVIAGASAGGHLAALVGVASGFRFEDTAQTDQSQDGACAAIVSFYGASNLETILSQSTPHGLSVRVPALELLLGGQPETEARMARLASPVFHVDASDPPLLLLHGDQDPQMPINQSHELVGKYRSAGLIVAMEVVHDAAHGGDAFYTNEMLGKVRDFMRKQF